LNKSIEAALMMVAVQRRYLDANDFRQIARAAQSCKTRVWMKMRTSRFDLLRCRGE
jgi:hypothetical protein